MNTNYREVKPTETFIHKNTVVEVYGKLNARKVAEVIHRLKTKYNI